MADPYPMPTAVQTRSATNADAFKVYCKIDEAYKGQDDEIETILAAVKRDVDKTLWNYFTHNDLPTGTPVDIPEDVELFIKKRAARHFEWRVERQEQEKLDQEGSAALRVSTGKQSADVDDYEPILYLRDPLGLIGF